MPGYHSKLLNGARNAGKLYSKTLQKFFASWKFKQSIIETFIQTAQVLLYFVLGALDIAFMTNPFNLISKFKTNLKVEFDAKIYGPLYTFIRWSIQRTQDATNVHQRSYVEGLLQLFGMPKCNAVSTLLLNCVDLSNEHKPEAESSTADHFKFSLQIGCLAHISTCTRPEFTFFITALAWSFQHPSLRHLELAKRICRYLAGTINYSIVIKTIITAI